MDGLASATAKTPRLSKAEPLLKRANAGLFRWNSITTPAAHHSSFRAGCGEIGCHVSLDLASFQDIVETSDPEPTVSIGLEQHAMLTRRIGIAVFP
jgi:hypothetical protein